MTAPKENARPGSAISRTGGGNANLVLPSTESMRRVPHRDSITPKTWRQDVFGRFDANGDIFQRVKEAVTVPDAAAFYGYEPNRAGKIRCPFHSEKTPSFQLWSDHWYCFGACKEGGDVVRFVEKLFSLSPLDAVKRLNADFSLGLSLDRHKATPEELEASNGTGRGAAVRELADAGGVGVVHGGGRRRSRQAGQDAGTGTRRRNNGRRRNRWRFKRWNIGTICASVFMTATNRNAWRFCGTGPLSARTLQRR